MYIDGYQQLAFNRTLFTKRYQPSSYNQVLTPIYTNCLKMQKRLARYDF